MVSLLLFGAGSYMKIKALVFIAILIWGWYKIYTTESVTGYVDLGLIETAWNLRFPLIALLIWLTLSTFFF